MRIKTSCLQGVAIAQQCPLASKYVGATSYHVNEAMRHFPST